jgi:hypothetical protein
MYLIREEQEMLCAMIFGLLVIVRRDDRPVRATRAET